MTFRKLFVFLPLLSALAACDEGDIYTVRSLEASGERVATLRLNLDVSVGAWPSGLALKVAALDDNGALTLTSKSLPAQRVGQVEVTLPLPAEATRVALCVLNRLGQVVYTIDEETLDGGLTLTSGEGDLTVAGLLRSRLVNARCAACHGDALDLRKQGAVICDMLSDSAMTTPLSVLHYPKLGRNDRGLITILSIWLQSE